MIQLHSRTRYPNSEPTGASPQTRLRIHVVHTGARATQVALRAATDYAGSLGADFEVLVPQVVPYPLPLSEPPVRTSFTAQRIVDAFEPQSIEWTARICLCRDREAGIQVVLPPGSIVVVGLTRRWWPFRDALLVRGLRRMGHHVIVAHVRGRHA